MREDDFSQKERRYKELLSAALGCALPQAQARQATDTLFAHFGSYTGVFTAPREELERLLGGKAARFMGIAREMARAYLEASSQDIARVYDTESAVELFRPKFLGRQVEAVYLMLLDGQGHLLFNDLLNEGAVTSVPVYIRQLIGLCIRYSAQNVLMAHNHPSGSPLPSTSDLVATRQVELALESIEATLNDHIIFGRTDYLSFSRSGYLATIKREVRWLRQQALKPPRAEEPAIQAAQEARAPEESFSPKEVDRPGGRW